MADTFGIMQDGSDEFVPLSVFQPNISRHVTFPEVCDQRRFPPFKSYLQNPWKGFDGAFGASNKLATLVAGTLAGPVNTVLIIDLSHING